MPKILTLKDLVERFSFDPDGNLVIARYGKKVNIVPIVDQLRSGKSPEAILRKPSYSFLNSEDMEACQLFAKTQEREMYLKRVEDVNGEPFVKVQGSTKGIPVHRIIQALIYEQNMERVITKLLIRYEDILTCLIYLYAKKLLPYMVPLATLPRLDGTGGKEAYYRYCRFCRALILMVNTINGWQPFDTGMISGRHHCY